MEFFVGSNEAEVNAMDFFLACDEQIKQASKGELIAASDPELLRKRDKAYFEARLDEISEERKRDDGNMKGWEFRKVASFTNVPLFEALRIQEGLLKGKKEFYKLLQKYPQYRAYDRRGMDHPTETFVNGAPV